MAVAPGGGVDRGRGTGRRRRVALGALAVVGLTVVAVVSQLGRSPDDGGSEPEFSLEAALAHMSAAETAEFTIRVIRTGTQELERSASWDATTDVTAMIDTDSGRLTQRVIVDAANRDVYTDTASAFGGVSGVPEDWFLMDDGWGPSIDAAPALALHATSLAEVADALAEIQTVRPLGRSSDGGVAVERFEVTVPAELIDRSPLGFGQRVAPMEPVAAVIAVSADNRIVRIDFDRWDPAEPRQPFVEVAVDIVALDEPVEAVVPDPAEVVRLEA